jgi:hypothetical protein
MCTCRVPRSGGFKGFVAFARLWNQQLARLQRHLGFDSHPGRHFTLEQDSP